MAMSKKEAKKAMLKKIVAGKGEKKTMEHSKSALSGLKKFVKEESREPMAYGSK